MKNRLKAFRHKLTDFGLHLFSEKPIRASLLLSFLLTFTVECIARLSPVRGVVYLFTHPLFFLLNVLIVYFSYSLIQFFKKRSFFFSLITVIWLILAIIDAVLLGMRVQPLTAIDFTIFLTGLNIATAYLSIFEIILIALGSLAVIGGMVLLAVKSKKRTVRMKQVLMNFGITSGILALSVFTCGILSVTPKNYEYIKDAYDHYGFVYGLSCCVLDRGIAEPKTYSSESVSEALARLDDTEPTAVTDKPNVIFVQLESFFDISRLRGLTFSAEPTPTFRMLKETCTSGLLRVPSVGCGTANTEFEVLSGLNLDYFGTGEYPYETVLKTSCCETVAYNLKALGYSTHAIHNHSATFYDRNLVYNHLGFDTFQPLECMTHVVYNDIGWAKDQVLTEEILSALDSTDTSDFIFTVSVQGHGSYPKDYDAGADGIQVTGSAFSEALLSQYEYYVSQIHEMDAFICELMAALAARDDESVVVFYGDHLPSMDIEPSRLDSRNALDSEYVIWSTMDLPKNDRDLQTYQLASYVCEQIGITDGYINRLHQTLRDSTSYQDVLCLLEYDMLFGDRYAYLDYPYQPTDMKIGTYPVTVDAIIRDDGQTVLLGSGFTPFTQVYCNGTRAEAVWGSATTMILPDTQRKVGDVFTTRQIAQTGTVLSESEPYTVS